MSSRWDTCVLGEIDKHLSATEMFEAMRRAGEGGPHSAWGRRGQSGSALSKAFSAAFCSLDLQLRDKERQMIKERFKVSQGPPCMDGGGSCGNRGTELLLLVLFFNLFLFCLR